MQLSAFIPDYLFLCMMDFASFTKLCFLYIKNVQILIKKETFMFQRLNLKHRTSWVVQKKNCDVTPNIPPPLFAHKRMFRTKPKSLQSRHNMMGVGFRPR